MPERFWHKDVVTHNTVFITSDGRADSFPKLICAHEQDWCLFSPAKCCEISKERYAVRRSLELRGNVCAEFGRTDAFVVR